MSNDTLQHVYETPRFDIFCAISVKMLDVGTVFVVLDLLLGRRPFFNKHEETRLLLIFEQIVADIAVLSARRFDKSQ